MATQDERIRFTFDTKDNTSKALKKLVTNFLSVAAAIAAVRKAAKFLLESAKYAARVETLGVVTEALGVNAHIAGVEIRELERAIQAKGITTEAARQSLAKMMQAELDVADATDLARLAQDAAVIAGTNSSEAFERLINVIATGNVRMARTMGIQVDFNAAYKEMAKQLGITTDELTAQQKAQARANAVLKQGTKIAGAYEASMKSVGKQLSSTKRYVDEYRKAVGQQFIPVLGALNRRYQEWLDTTTKNIEVQYLLKEAHKVGIITGIERGKIQLDLTDGLIETTEVIKKYNVVLDEYHMGQEEEIKHLQNLHEHHMNLRYAKESAVDATLALSEATGWLDAATLMYTEGVTLETIAVWENVAALEAQKAAIDDLSGGLQNLAPLLKMGFDPYEGNIPGQQKRTGGGGGGWQIDAMGRKYKRDPQGYFIKGPGYAVGGSFTVPSGFPNDSYPMRVQSGEHVQVTPAGQSQNADVVAAINELKDEMYQINQELVAANS